MAHNGTNGTVRFAPYSENESNSGLLWILLHILGLPRQGAWVVVSATLTKVQSHSSTIVNYTRQFIYVC